MSERAMGEDTRKLLGGMIDGEIVDTLTNMAAASGTTNGSKLAMLCYAMARILRKFEENEIDYEPSDFACGEAVAADAYPDIPARIVGYDAVAGMWVLRVGTLYRAVQAKDMRKMT